MLVVHAPSYTAQQYRDVLHYNKYIQLYLWIGVLGLIGLVTLAHLIGRTLSYLRRKFAARWVGGKRPSNACSRTGKGCTKWIPGTMVATFRKACVRKSHTAERMGMSSLGEVAVVTFYYCFNIILVVCGANGHIDYMAHHAARLVFANLPLVIGLAAKNNVISYATGFSYESLNVFHRWCARLILILSTIHVAGRIYVNSPSVNPSRSGMYPPNGGGYIRWGIVAYILFTLLILGAVRPLRNKWYQYFLFLHIVAFLMGIVALAVHRPSVAPWLYVGLFIYFLDGTVRLGRIVYHHLVKRARPSEVEGPLGIVEALSEDTIRVSVQTTLSWIPGQHVYLHVPLLSPGGHPFSVCSIDKPLTQTDDTHPRVSTVVLIIRVREGLTRCLHRLAMRNDLPLQEDGHSQLHTHDIHQTHTRADAEKAIITQSSPQSFPFARLKTVWAEGPYGNLSHLDYYQTLLLVAGGSGVSFTLPVMLDLVRRARSMHLGHTSVAVATERVMFVWVIKEPEHVEWIGDFLREAIALAPPGFLHVKIHVTSKKYIADINAINAATSVPISTSKSTLPNPSPPGVPAPVLSSPPHPSTSTPSTMQHHHPNLCVPKTSISTTSNLTLIPGRPDVRELLEREIAVTDYSDYFAVGTCGPASMTQDLANAVSDAIHTDEVLRGEHRRNIRFHCEEFGW
ncbi:hypothetical protein FRB98_004255 [Tulasnella sp. 332]|nr:hypothetical protein FRB98_004255 [Tulasnella sp. 332]